MDKEFQLQPVELDGALLIPVEGHSYKTDSGRIVHELPYIAWSAAPRDNPK